MPNNQQNSPSKSKTPQENSKTHYKDKIIYKQNPHQRIIQSKIAQIKSMYLQVKKQTNINEVEKNTFRNYLAQIEN